ncbi:RHS repeat-associated core domain-containing protein [Amycolatopsis xylanica]|uniref:RHS repeat-associated core domain-containing protein n=1 Tax=Amycolatopsis xylanica TaxID=589385 RepID=A0A1H3H582_9PSEU|nr:DUF6531 domain-containing protein [Amycolatopsis xylanica]SDY10666.1 RHS repeat-associated core domain-containing protein [Amycolatopsis xylanica]
MPDGNPLVAQAKSQTTAVTGIGIAESAVDLASGVKDGSWVEGGLGALGMGLEVLSLAIDPIGTLAQYGVSWLIEHVQPLKEALDWLAGDPPVIQSYSDTWANVAKEVNSIAGDFGNEAKNGTAGWSGQAGDAYRGEVAEQVDAIQGAATLADGVSTGVMVMGQVVAMVRETVRDLVAELVGKLISWALEEACTLGFATPLVAVQATTAITKAISKVSDLIRKLVKTIGNVAPKLRKIIDKLGEIIEKLSKLGKKLGKGGGTSPSAAKAAKKTDGPDVPKGDTSPSASHTPDETGPSSTHSGDTSPSSAKDKTGTNRPKDPDDTKTPETERRCENDPIDVVTGEMVLGHIDIELPGVLPLVLRRTHVSSYRAGRLFGRSWASTVDQRLEFDEQGVVFVAEDGMLLVYPDPPVSGEVMPVAGPRWPLWRTDTGFAIRRRDNGHTLHFVTGASESPLSAIVDRNGNSIEFDHDEAGMLTAVRHSGGYHLEVDTAGGRVTELRMRDAAVTVVQYTYGHEDRLTEVVNSSGQSLKFTYDLAGRITQWTDRGGEWYRYLYDAQGRCVANLGSGGFLNGTFTYENLTTRFTDALGHTTTFQLNAARQIVAETNALGHTTTCEWDEHDRLLSRTDPLGQTTRFLYDEVGNLVTTTRPDGVQVLAEYDDSGRLTTFIDPNGAVWRQEFDDRGNLVAATDPAGATTRYRYNDRGHRVAVTDALGGVRRIETNDAGIPVAITDAAGATTRYECDQFGRVSAITDPLGGTTRFTWTVEGKLVSRTRPDGSAERWRYDAEGNGVEHIGAHGQVTRTETTHFNLPSAETGPDGTRLEFGYDATLRLVSVTNAQGLRWQYDYDDAGNLVRETDFNGRAVTYAYDAAGRLIERVNGAGQSTRFVRDVMGAIVERRCGDAVTTIGYDAAGRLIHARNADAELRYQRDALGQVLAETVNGRTVSSTYDALGRRVLRRTPTGAESRWGYAANGKPSSLETGGRTLFFGYDPAGREVERLLDTGTMLAQAWDENHRLVAQTVSAVSGDSAAQARQIQQRRYHYRADDHVAAIEDQLGGTRRFDLDPAGRVLAVEGGGWQERYAYDAAGNLTQATRPSVPGQDSLEYGGTLIRRAGDIHYQHDAQGRMVVRQKKRLSRKPDTWHYEWDADDRLVAVITPDRARWRYRYDPLGRRIAKQRFAPDGSVAEQVDFAWDGAVLAEQTHSSGQATTWEFDPASFRPLTQVERAPADQEWVDRQFYAIVTDIVGTPTELVDARGELTWRQEATLWGEAVGALTNRAYTPLRFPGQYHDQETGLHYNYHRYYDPAAGRYSSGDPLGLPGGPSPHAYVHNPIGWTDALGLTESGDIEWADPADINFSQRTITQNEYADIMRNGGWDWERSPLHVIEVDGQLVSYDNRRLDAAREVGRPVAITRVDPNAVHPDSTTGKTWADKFRERMRSPRNRLDGVPVPDNGLSERPTPEAPGCGGGRRRRRR